MKLFGKGKSRVSQVLNKGNLEKERGRRKGGLPFRKGRKEA